MTSYTVFDRTQVGVVITPGTKLVSFGDYIGARFGISDSEFSQKLNDVLSVLSVPQLRVLSAEITTGSGDIVGAYRYLHSNQDCSDTNSLNISNSVSFKNYSSYVSSSSMKNMSLLKAVSQLPSFQNRKDVPFVFEDGVVSVNTGDKVLPLNTLAKECSDVLTVGSSVVEVKAETVLERVAVKAFRGNTDAVESFMNSPDKVVSGINLSDSAVLFRNGKLTGTVNQPIKVGPMTTEVSVYLGSAQNLQAMFVNSNGINNSNSEIPHGSEFIKCGADLFRLGYNNRLNSAILESCKISSETTNEERQQEFERVMAIKDASLLPEYIAFNFSWLASEYSKSHGNVVLLNEFKTKYKLLFLSSPIFAGKGPIEYLLRLNSLKKSCSPSNFFKIPKTIDKLLGHYNIMSCFFYGTPLSKVLDLFFKRNRSAMSLVVKEAFSLYVLKYEFSLVRQGVVTKDGWTFDDDDIIPYNDEGETVVEFVDYGAELKQVEKSSKIKRNTYGGDDRQSLVVNSPLHGNSGFRVENSKDAGVDFKNKKKSKRSKHNSSDSGDDDGVSFLDKALMAKANTVASNISEDPTHPSRNIYYLILRELLSNHPGVLTDDIIRSLLKKTVGEFGSEDEFDFERIEEVVLALGVNNAKLRQRIVDAIPISVNF